MARKPRRGEFVCDCPAYDFPHRQFGGECSGLHLAADYWNRHFGQGDCDGCHNCTLDDGPACQVAHGGESPQTCPVVQEHVHLNAIKVYRKRGRRSRKTA